MVNPAKSAVAPARDRSFLGYSFWHAPGKIVKRRVAPKALEAMKERVREITSRNGGRSLAHVVALLRSYLMGWKAYFRLADTPGVFTGVDQWIHRRLRMLILKQRKRGTTLYRTASRAGTSRTPGARGGGALCALVGDGDARRAEHGLSGAILRLHWEYRVLAPHNLNSPNRRMRTRMSGGVGGK